MQAQQFAAGTTVYDAAGEKVGTLRAYNPQAGYLLVEKGWLFPKDLYIPLDAVGLSDAAGVSLQIHKDDLQDERYNYPPTGGAWGAEGEGQRVTTTEPTTMRAQGAPPPAPAHRPAPTAAQSDETISVPVYEEELVVGKRTEEQGRVHLHKDVVEERETVSVPLEHERVTIERRPVTGQASPADLQNAFREQEIEVPVMGEEAVVSKQAHVVEEVRLHKDEVTEQEQVTGTVRKEHVTVDSAPDALLREDGPRGHQSDGPNRP